METCDTPSGTHTLWGRMVPPSVGLPGPVVNVTAAWLCIPESPSDGVWVVRHDPDRHRLVGIVVEAVADYAGYVAWQAIHLRVQGGAVVGYEATDLGDVGRLASSHDWSVYDGESLVARLAAIPGVGPGVFDCRPIRPAGTDSTE